MSRTLTVALVFAGLLVAPMARAEGKYTRRQKARGEVTDTAPKLDRFAFINDAAPEPDRLVLLVDTWLARGPHDARFLPLVVALSFEGRGPALPIRPDRFRLTWRGCEQPIAALTHGQLVEAAAGPTPVYDDLRMLAHRAPLAFDTPNAERMDAQFYTHVALRTLVHDEFRLRSEMWFDTLMYFPVPLDFDRWDELFELQYVPVDGGPAAVACAFRIQRDPSLHQAAMRRARKALERASRKEP